MPALKLIAGFFWRFALVYGLLLSPWPGFNGAYGRYLRSLGEAVFAREGGSRLVRFEPVPPGLNQRLDSRILLSNRNELDSSGRGSARYLELDSRGIGWMPTAFFVALVAASPVSWRRRSGALLVGLGAIHGFILFSLAVYIWNQSTDLALLTLAPAWKYCIAGLEETLVTQIGASFVVPGLIWILLTFQRQDVIAWQTAESQRRAQTER